MCLSPSQWEMNGHNGAHWRLPIKGWELQSPFPMCWECDPKGVSLGKKGKFCVCYGGYRVGVGAATLYEKIIQAHLTNRLL